MFSALSVYGLRRIEPVVHATSPIVEIDDFWSSRRAVDDLLEFRHALARLAVPHSEISRSAALERLEGVRDRMARALSLGAVSGGSASTMESAEDLIRALDAVAPILAEIPPNDRGKISKLTALIDAHLTTVRQVASGARFREKGNIANLTRRVEEAFIEMPILFIGILVSGVALVVLLVREIRRSRRLASVRSQPLRQTFRGRRGNSGPSGHVTPPSMDH